jgi:hypothetical protein
MVGGKCIMDIKLKGELAGALILLTYRYTQTNLYCTKKLSSLLLLRSEIILWTIEDEDCLD